MKPHAANTDHIRVSEAMQQALYGQQGFWRQEVPRDHFRTSAHSRLFAKAMLFMVEEVDSRLGHPVQLDVVDVGAGSGEILMAIMDSASPRLRERLHCVGVEMRPRPAYVPSMIEWVDDIPPCSGLLIANELLDNVPCDVALSDETGEAHYLLVDPMTGEETIGECLKLEDAQWLQQWWPLSHPNECAEIGIQRDMMWERTLAQLTAGTALMIDYGHFLNDRHLSISSYQSGRKTTPTYDGSCDITAHVAIDSIAEVARRYGGVTVERQRDALRRLGIQNIRPPLALASEDPASYLSALRDVSEAAELTNLEGLGSFWWVKCDAPDRR